MTRARACEAAPTMVFALPVWAFRALTMPAILRDRVPAANLAPRPPAN